MNPPEPDPAPSPPTRLRRKTMDEIRRFGLMSSDSLPMETDLLNETVESALPPASEMSPSPLRVARSPHPLDGFSFDQLCPADDEEAGGATLQGQTPAERQQALPKGPFKGPTNKVMAPLRERKSERFVPKTMLDHSLILQNLSVSIARSQEKLAQKVAEKEAEPPKPCIPIENYKMAQKTCPFTWGEMDAPKDRFRYCDKCNANVYNFAGMDLPEAEELIFKREERRNAPLFKRADGKFMTRDCPFALKKKYGLAMMVAGGILVLAILAGLSMLMPPPPKPAEAPSTDATPQVETMPSQPQPNATQTGSDSGQGNANEVPPVTLPEQPPVQEPNSNETPGSPGA
ncbi:MAG: hypothetical protein IT342_21335 [Candidatus Melainabacteria bacterium]|nr:hypothetical protein [Candidatus Melainabacteria bacterium]